MKQKLTPTVFFNLLGAIVIFAGILLKLLSMISVPIFKTLEIIGIVLEAIAIYFLAQEMKQAEQNKQEK